jgi:hypothetical protein
MLEACLDYDSLVASTDRDRRKSRQIVEQRLMPLVRRAGGGVFLDGRSGGRVALTESLRCGALFIREGSALGEPSVAAVGRGLLVSALGQMQDTGFLPSELEISRSGVTRRKGAVAPEEVYSLAGAARLFPREIPLSRSLGDGAWIYTAADLAPVESSPAGFTLVLSFPVGLAHYLVIHGVRPFSQLRLHGIPWRQDPTYFQYTDGYFYDAPDLTLYMKITPRVPREEIVVSYPAG